MTVTEAEWRHDVDDVIEMSDHDARCAVWLVVTYRHTLRSLRDRGR